MDKDYEKREKELDEFSIWYEKEYDFIELIFSSNKLRLSFEYIPSFLILLLSNENLREEFYTDDIVFNYCYMVMTYFREVIENMKAFYKLYDNKITKLEDIAEELYYYFVLYDIKIYIDYSIKENTPYPDFFQKIVDFWFTYGKKLYQKEKIDKKYFKKIDTFYEDIKKEYEAFNLLNEEAYLMTEKFGAPMHNISLK